MFLLLSGTGARFGEAAALRWSDIDLEGGTARIERSFSSGRYLGLTKTGGQRTVELSSRLQAALASQRPDLFPQDALAFPNTDGSFIDPTNFRRRVFDRVVRRAFGRDHRRVTPHTLRHTFASLHLARGSNLLWVQNMGGWQSPQVMLDTYTHFLPTKLSGFADSLTAPSGGTFSTYLSRAKTAGLLETEGRSVRTAGALLLKNSRDRRSEEILEALELQRIEFHASIQGRIHNLTVGADPQFLQIRELSTGLLIRCQFKPRLYGQVIALLQSPATVVMASGFATGSREARRIESIDVDRLEAAEDFSLEDLDSFFGSAPHITGEKSTEDFIDGIRPAHG